MVSYSLQINRHAPIAVYTVMAMVDTPDLLLDFRFVRMILCLPVLSVIIIPESVKLNRQKQNHFIIRKKRAKNIKNI